MTDMEKVIKGLEQFIADLKPFCGNKADWRRIYDALALLEAQIPRILSLDELRELAMDMDNVVWVEYAGKNARLSQHAQADIYFRNPTLVILRVFGEDEGLEPNNEEYGKTWRCWNTKPSNEQMEGGWNTSGIDVDRENGADAH